MIGRDAHSGYIAILGRPNVGKSTLLNKILGSKVTITSRKPQTTRHRILGINTAGDYQAIYVDTPGIHQNKKSKLNAYMNRAALGALKDVDIIAFVAAGTIWNDEDEWVLGELKKTGKPIILVINKVDLIKQKKDLLFCIEKVAKKHPFAAIVPLSAKNSANVEVFSKEINKLLPKGPWFFSPDTKTDRDERFLVSELIREKLIRHLGQELPYSITVLVDRFDNQPNLLSILATIYVERVNHRMMVIGKGGANLKKIGSLARGELENIFAKKIFLQLWVKVKSNWTKDDKLLQDLGYAE